MNPITLYLTSNFIGGLGYHKLATRLAGGRSNNSSTPTSRAGCGELMISLTGRAPLVWFAWFLHRRKNLFAALNSVLDSTESPLPGVRFSASPVYSDKPIGNNP